jgi:Lipocalin-like domain
MPLDRDLILGSWRMKSWVTTDVATGERRDALGENVRAFALYTPERVMFLILDNNRKPPERSPPSDEEKIALYDAMFAYSGSYTVESDRVIGEGPESAHTGSSSPCVERSGIRPKPRYRQTERPVFIQHGVDFPLLFGCEPINVNGQAAPVDFLNPALSIEMT